MEAQTQLSLEAARISQLSIDGKESLINLLKDLFGENKSDADFMINSYWETLQAAMASEDTSPVQRQNWVMDTKQNVATITVLYSLFQELKLD